MTHQSIAPVKISFSMCFQDWVQHCAALLHSHFPQFKAECTHIYLFLRRNLGKTRFSNKGLLVGSKEVLKSFNNLLAETSTYVHRAALMKTHTNTLLEESSPREHVVWRWCP